MSIVTLQKTIDVKGMQQHLCFEQIVKYIKVKAGSDCIIPKNLINFNNTFVK